MFKLLANKVTDWLAYEPPTTEMMPYDFKRMKHEIRPGDVLLIEGRSRISSVIRTLTQSSWTHAALYVGRLIDFEDQQIGNIIRQHTKAKDNTRLVLESLVDKGTVVHPLNTYKNHHIRICRPIGITEEDTYNVILHAIQSLGKPYNVRHLFELARYLLPWTILPRRWGSSLFRTTGGEPEPGVCSAIIAEAFESVEFPILPYIIENGNATIELYHRNPHLFTPKDFDVSPYFNIIKYPLFSAEEPLPYYRQLPWSKSGRVYQDKGILSGTRPPKKTFTHKKSDDNKDDDE